MPFPLVQGYYFGGMVLIPESVLCCRGQGVRVGPAVEEPEREIKVSI